MERFCGHEPVTQYEAGASGPLERERACSYKSELPRTHGGTVLVRGTTGDYRGVSVDRNTATETQTLKYGLGVRSPVGNPKETTNTPPPPNKKHRNAGTLRRPKRFLYRSPYRTLGAQSWDASNRWCNGRSSEPERRIITPAPMSIYF